MFLVCLHCGDKLMKKYICYGGPVPTGGGFRVYIEPYELCYLYGVDQHECIFINDSNRDFILKGLDKSNLIELWPDPSGRYELTDC